MGATFYIDDLCIIEQVMQATMQKAVALQENRQHNNCDPQPFRKLGVSGKPGFSSCRESATDEGCSLGNRSLLLMFQTNRNSKSPSEVSSESRKVKERRFIRIFAVERQMKLMKTDAVVVT